MSLVGNLDDLGLGEILQIVSLSRKSGTLSLRSQGREATVVFRQGQVVRASSSKFPQSLGELLTNKSVIDSGEGLARIPHDRIPVLYCKTGVRSARALKVVREAGFSKAVHLQGGIAAWAEQVQPDMAIY